jgi:hypothetical protein
MKWAVVAAIMLASVIDFAPRSKPDNSTKKVAGSGPDQYSTIIINQTKEPSSNQKQEATANQPSHWYSSPEWVLVFIGGGTAFVIGWQSWETRKAAQASSKSAVAFVTAERAWVIADLVPMARNIDGVGWCWGSEPTMPSEWNRLSVAEVLKGEHLRHGLKFINMGRSTARITGYDVQYGFFDWKNERLRINRVDYNRDFERMLPANETTGILPNQTIDIHEYVSNPAAGVDEWKYWMVVLVKVTYEHIFSIGHPQTDLFRFAYNPKTSTMERKATTEADKKQAQRPVIAVKLETKLPPN